MAIIPIGNDQKLKTFPLVTVGLIIVNSAVMCWLPFQDYRTIYREYGWVVGDPRPLALLTSQFLHGGIGHLVGNMLFLWTFGSGLESAIGKVRFIAIYLVGGVVADLTDSLQTAIFLSPESLLPMVGASGAIAAVMGMYIVRCYFSRIRVVVNFFSPFLIVPKRFNVSAIPVLFLFIAMNLYYGLKYLDHQVYVAFWAHIGGFFFGAGTSLLFGHRRDAGLDMRRQRSSRLIETDLGLKQARDDLETLVSADPTDGGSLLELARMDSRYLCRPSGRQLYHRAVLAFWQKGERLLAIEAYRELLTRYNYALPGQVQIDICRELIRGGLYDQAARALEALIKAGNMIPGRARAEVLERAYLMLGPLLANHLGATEMARKIFLEFLNRFPASGEKETVEARLRQLA
jgi:membrane associated rhomboid family serine protease